MMQNAWRGALIYLCGLVSASDEVRRLLSRRVLLPSGLTTACVIVSPRTNQISQIIEGLDASSDCCIDECDDWGDLVILPGGIDPHVHVSEPGQTFEGFASASVAALVGGTTTFLDMPLNSVPASTSMPALVEKWKAMAAAFNGDGDGGGDGDNQALLAVDVGLIGGAVPGNSAHLPKLATDGGVLAFKSFMLPSQSEDFPGSDLPDLKATYRVLADSFGASSPPLMLHAELPPERFQFDPFGEYDGDAQKYADYERRRPPSWEVEAIHRMTKVVLGQAVVREQEDLRPSGSSELLAEAQPALQAVSGPGSGLPPVHFVHLSSPEAVDAVGEMRETLAKRLAPGVNVTVTGETCTHYLLFASEEIGDGQTLLKCAPPIRNSTSRLELVRHLLHGNALGKSSRENDSSHAPQAVKKDVAVPGGKGETGVLTMVTSDHSPAELWRRASGDFKKSWGGIAGLQYRLFGLWTSLVKFSREASRLDSGGGTSKEKEEGGDMLSGLLSLLSSLFSTGAAAAFGLSSRKGEIREGMDGDLIVFDPEHRWEVASTGCLHRHPESGFDGRTLRGGVAAAYVGGGLVFAQKCGEGSMGRGSARTLGSAKTRRPCLKEQEEKEGGKSESDQRALILECPPSVPSRLVEKEEAGQGNFPIVQQCVILRGKGRLLFRNASPCSSSSSSAPPSDCLSVSVRRETPSSLLNEYSFKAREKPEKGYTGRSQQQEDQQEKKDEL